MRISFIAGRTKPWKLDLGLIGGKRQRLFFESKAKAESAEKLRDGILRRHGEDALALPVPKRLEYIAAEERLVKLGATIMQAVLFYETHSRGFAPKPLVIAISECVESKRMSGKRPLYVGALNRSLAAFLKTCPAVMASDVTRAQIESWIRGAGDLSLATVRSRLIDVRTLFSFCLKRKWVLDNPAIQVEPITLDDKPPGIHTLPEVGALLKCALEHDRGLLGYICSLYFGGLRPIEAKRLRASDVHSDYIEVQGVKSKTRQRRFITINETLKAWLAVPGVQFGMSPRSRRLDRLKFVLAEKEPENPKLVKSAFPWPHDVLRHSFCSYGLPVFGATKVAEWAGHSEQILFAHYRERVKPDDAKAYWALRPS